MSRARIGCVKEFSKPRNPGQLSCSLLGGTTLQRLIGQECHRFHGSVPSTKVCLAGGRASALAPGAGGVDDHAAVPHVKAQSVQKKMGINKVAEIEEELLKAGGSERFRRLSLHLGVQERQVPREKMRGQGDRVAPSSFTLTKERVLFVGESPWSWKRALGGGRLAH